MRGEGRGKAGLGQEWGRGAWSGVRVTKCDYLQQLGDYARRFLSQYVLVDTH